MIVRLLYLLGIRRNAQAETTPYNLEEDLKRIQQRLRRRQEAARISRTQKRGFDGKKGKA